MTIATVTIRSQPATTRPGCCADPAGFTNVAEHTPTVDPERSRAMFDLTMTITRAGFVGVTPVRHG